MPTVFMSFIFHHHFLYWGETSNIFFFCFFFLFWRLNYVDHQTNYMPNLYFLYLVFTDLWQREHTFIHSIVDTFVPQEPYLCSSEGTDDGEVSPEVFDLFPHESLEKSTRIRTMWRQILLNLGEGIKKLYNLPKYYCKYKFI